MAFTQGGFKYVVAGFSLRSIYAKLLHSGAPERGLKPATTYSSLNIPRVSASALDVLIYTS